MRVSRRLLMRLVEQELAEHCGHCGEELPESFPFQLTGEHGPLNRAQFEDQVWRYAQSRYGMSPQQLTRMTAYIAKAAQEHRDPLEFVDSLARGTREGVSVNGAEGLGGHGEGFEQQNQGVTRRSPGEGAKVNGGRSQSQEMEDYGDQPQYAPPSEQLQWTTENEMPWGGLQDPGGWDRQVATGITGDGTDQTDEER